MENKIIKLRCKPTFNFQSIEFEYDVEENNSESITNCMKIYKELIDALIAVAPEQESVKKPVRKIVSEPATEKQIAIMEKFGIKFKDTISKSEAQALIKSSIEKAHK